MEILGFDMTKEELLAQGDELIAKIDEAIDREGKTAVGIILTWDEGFVAQLSAERYHREDDPRYSAYNRFSDTPPRKGLNLLFVWRKVNVWIVREDSDSVTDDY